jgi:hypothetical protein
VFARGGKRSRPSPCALCVRLRADKALRFALGAGIGARVLRPSGAFYAGSRLLRVSAAQARVATRTAHAGDGQAFHRRPSYRSVDLRIDAASFVMEAAIGYDGTAWYSFAVSGNPRHQPGGTDDVK